MSISEVDGITNHYHYNDPVVAPSAQLSPKIEEVPINVSSRISRIAASILSGSAAAAGCTLLTKYNFHPIIYSLVVAATVICGIAAAIFAYLSGQKTTASRTSTQEDLIIDGDYKNTVTVSDQEIASAFYKDSDRDADVIFLKTADGVMSLRQFCEKNVKDFALITEDDVMKKTISEAFVKYLLENLGEDRKHLIFPITVLSSQNGHFYSEMEKNKLLVELKGASSIFKDPKELPGEKSNIHRSLTLEIPKEGPVTIALERKDRILKIEDSNGNETEFKLPGSYESEGKITIDLSGKTRLEMNAALTL